MAARSLFLAFTRKCRANLNGVNISKFINPTSGCKHLSSGALNRDHDVVEEAEYQEIDDLKSRIFRLRLPKRSATNVLQKWVSEGNDITISDLRQISKDLRKSQRYKHALEISEWMVAHKPCDLSDSDYAVCIDLMAKVFGVDSAERYFEGLAPSAKTSETYTALLHSFAGAKLIRKAEELFERIKESGLSFSALTFNEMMTLYMSVGQVEKVSSVIEELKRQKVAADIFTYNLWISSCAAALNIDEVRRVLDEMSHDPGSNEDWRRYVDLTNIYINTGNFVNTENGSLVETDKSITQREWITYDFLLILYAGLGKKDKIDQIWKSLRMTKQKMTSRNYVCILSSYLMLGHIKEVGEVIDQWKQCTTTSFDISSSNKLLDAYVDAGFSDKANEFRVVLIEKNCNAEDVAR